AARAWRRGEGGESGKADYREFVQTTLHNMTDEAIRKLPNATPEIVEQMLWLKHASPEELERQLAQWYRTGEVFHQPEFWDDSRFNHPAQPVVGVSWFEAQAYCAWLAAQTGQAYRLPTEVEWEAAARGRAGRAYAYGQAYDAAHCNTFESHIRRTTPVGVYPGGQTPEGIADLSGNVWEWTSSEYRPYRYDPADGREELEDAAARRVLRGGSWSDDADLAPAASRVSFTPAYRGGNFGFRLVV
ncbi:MAG: SUMF1/EgtB/PvdO family nonheme iron enzyme, partial [Anaerolineales bacterium]|nr:SUMF1/EgtB/PvdO family nonheme iron enzyme [Anaerolineales bacterium]